MEYFSNSAQAKEFLASRVIHEAALQEVPLSELEQKMLYFTESGPTLPNMLEIAERFDDEYDQQEYESKVRKLAQSALKRAKEAHSDEYDRWLNAIRVVNTEDHYIGVLVGADHGRSATHGLLATC